MSLEVGHDVSHCGTAVIIMAMETAAGSFPLGESSFIVNCQMTLWSFRSNYPFVLDEIHVTARNSNRCA